MVALGASWFDDGSPYSVTLPDGAPVLDATLPMLVTRPQDPTGQANVDCGPVFTAQFSFDASRTAAAGFPVRSLDWVEQILSNATEYVEAFQRNQQSQPSSGGKGDGGAGKPQVKL
jgi:hypothetical protein